MSACPPLVFVIDNMDFRRAGLVHYLVEWAALERVSLLSVRSEQACQELRDRTNECRMVVLNVGAASCADSDVLSEIKVIRMLAPSAFVAVVADEENPEDVLAAMQVGAAAYISNRSDPAIVLRALSFVLQGGTYFPRRVVEVAMEFFSDHPLCAEPDGADGALEDQSRLASIGEFSERQRSILAGVCRGEPNKIIGRRLGLPESTVKVHVREIMRKLGVSNRTQVAIVASSLAEAALEPPPSREPSRRLPLPFDRTPKLVDGFDNSRKLGDDAPTIAPDGDGARKLSTLR